MLSSLGDRECAVRVAPFPAGKDFTFTFVDDTDLSTRANTEPVYEFLWRHGIFGTKTVWALRRKRISAYRRDLERAPDLPDHSGDTLEDPDYLDFVRTLAGRGYEIALHGVAGGNSLREEIVQGLEVFRASFGSYPRINIFHERNIDNLYAGRHKLDLWPFRLLESLLHRSEYLGHVPGSPYYWGDLAQQKIDYMRVPFHTLRGVNTLRLNPGMPFRDPRRPCVNYWFANSDGSDVRRFNALLKPANLARLEREQGACIAYTHFAKGFSVSRGGRFELDAGFAAIVKDLAGRANAWFPTASGLLDRLRAIRALTVEQDGCEIRLVNTGAATVDAVALQVRDGVVLADEAGRTLAPSQSGLVAVGQVPGNAVRRLSSSVRLPRRSCLGANAAIGKIERARLEVLNYLGMLRGEP